MDKDKFKQKLISEGFDGVVNTETQCGCTLEEFPACVDEFDSEFCEGGYVRLCEDCPETEDCELHNLAKSESCIHRKRLDKE